MLKKNCIFTQFSVGLYDVFRFIVPCQFRPFINIEPTFKIYALNKLDFYNCRVGRKSLIITISIPPKPFFNHRYFSLLCIAKNLRKVIQSGGYVLNVSAQNEWCGIENWPFPCKL